MVDVEYTDEFEAWWGGLTEESQKAVAHTVQMLATVGVSLSRPYAAHVAGSAFGHMRELRVKHAGHQYRVFYVFDPRRTAVLLIGGDKVGHNQDAWYATFIGLADDIYRAYLNELKDEPPKT